MIEAAMPCERAVGLYQGLFAAAAVAATIFGLLAGYLAKRLLGW